MTSDQVDDPVLLLAVAWRDAGLRAPVATTPLTDGGCEFPGCSSRSIVLIKTDLGPVRVCFDHFEAVKRAIERMPGRR